jgi:hypothetical protein
VILVRPVASGLFDKLEVNPVAIEEWTPMPSKR